MSIMGESDHTENEAYSARPPATRDWLRHANQSLSRLQDVKKTSYRLGGGPREREVNCQCNYRSKSKSSFLSLESEPPQLALDSQETASMPDLSIPEIVKQFNERQLQKSKQKRRPHSSTIYSAKSTTRKQDKEKAPEYNYNAFITVKGQTVTPQLRPPPGSLPITDVKKDDSEYKGLVYLDRQQVEQHQTSTLEGLRRYSAVFGDDEDTASTIPPPPRASPEPTSPRTNSPEFIDSVSEESFSEDDDNGDLINKSSETRSLSSAGSRSLVFAIPTAGDEGTASDDEETASDFKAGRLSANYVAKSEALLGELSEKNQTEAAEISDMFLDMESAKERISELRISPRDLELESSASKHSTSVASPVHLVNTQIEYPPVDETRQEHGLYETFWVAEPAESYISNALPSRNSRVCSARYMSQHTADSGRVRKHQSESSLVLKGKTMEFFNSEDLAAKNRMRDTRRTSKPNDFTDEEHNTCTNKVSTKPPLPNWNTTKNNRKQNSRQKHRSDDKTSVQYQPAKSSLRKSNSEGNIPLSVTESQLSVSSNLSKKSVTFSQDVLSQNDEVDNIEGRNASKPTLKSCLWSASHSGVVIQNGLEMKEAELQIQENPETAVTDKESKVGHTHKTNPTTRAKLLAKMKEIPHEEEPCPCRTVTRPTAALLTESRSGKAGTKETSSRNEKLLKNRPTRPSSAPIKRSPGSNNELTTERPKSPRRKPRAMSATVQRKRTGAEGGLSRPRPSSARVGRTSSKDAHRSRAAAKVLKEGYLFKERPPPALPPGSRERQLKKDEKSRLKEDNNNNNSLRNKDEDEVVASEECQEVFARLQEKGIDVSMDTIKRGLMAPARRANDYQVATMGSSSGLLSRPENWLPEEHARVQIWENVLKRSK